MKKIILDVCLTLLLGCQMAFMRRLGRNMAWFLKLREAGSAVGIPLPEQEETRIATNFIR